MWLTFPVPVKHSDNCHKAAPPQYLSAGFTVIELITVMAIVAIIMGLGVPSFHHVFKNGQQSTQYSSLRKSIEFARSEAIKRSNHISVCARASEFACGSDWSNGWLVFSDSDAGNAGTIDGDDAVLRRVDFTNNAVTIKVSAIIRPTAMQSQSSIRFSPRGRANWTVGTVLFCDQRGEKSAMAIIVNGSGGIRAAYPPNPGSQIVLDAVGNAVTCA